MRTHLCHTCSHAEWETTQTGRRTFKVPGKCTYPLPDLPKLPTCVEPVHFYRRVIWKDDGEKCPTWSDTYTLPTIDDEPEKLKLNLLREGDPLDG